MPRRNRSGEAAARVFKRWNTPGERERQAKVVRRQGRESGSGKFKRPSIIRFTEETPGLSLSPAQRTLLKSIYGERLTATELDLFKKCTGRSTYPGREFTEVTVLAGARSGKDSRIAAPVAVYEAVYGRHEKYLAKGEKGRVTIVAQDVSGAGIAFEYVKAGFEESQRLSKHVEPERGKTRNQLRLRNGLIVQTFSSTKASTRGFSIPVAILDEVAFWRLEGSADSDIEILTSIRRGMLNFPAPKLIKISTPYMKSGVLHEDYKNFYATDSEDVLVWVAPTTLMNPTITEERLARERRLMDSARFRREYEAEFAEDVETFLSSEWIDRAIETGVSQRPPLDEVTYVAACDPSGGGPDAMTLAIVHREGNRIVQDVMKAWSRKSAREGVTEEAADLLKSYRVSKVFGDRYGGAWIREAFKRHGVVYTDATIVKNNEPVYLDRSSAYLEVEPLFASGLIALLDHPVMAREFVILERRPSPTGKDRVDHPRGKHDDHCNAVALASAIAARGSVGKSGGGQVLVLEKKPAPMAVAVERLRQRAPKWNVPESWTDPRGEDPTREPTSANRDPWGWKFGPAQRA